MFVQSVYCCDVIMAPQLYVNLQQMLIIVNFITRIGMVYMSNRQKKTTGMKMSAQGYPLVFNER